MSEELEKKLAEDALKTASPEITTKVIGDEREELKQIFSQVIEETVQVSNPEFEKLQEFKARLQRIKDRRDKIEKRIENEDLDLWIFQQRLDEFDDDLNPDWIYTSIESELEDMEDWLNESIPRPWDDESDINSGDFNAQEEPDDGFLAGIESMDMKDESKKEEPPVRGWPESVDESLTEFEERLDEFESRLSSPTGWFEEYHEHLEDFSKQLDNPEGYHEHLEDFIKQLDNPEGYIDGLRQDIDEFVQCLNDPTNISDSFDYGPFIEDFVDNISEDMEYLNSEYERLKKELEPYERQYQSFESYFDGYRKELDSVQDRLANYEATLESIRSDLDSAGQIVDGFGTSASVFRVRVQELEEEINSLEEDINSKELRLGVLESQIDKIDNLEEKRKELFHLAKDNQELGGFVSRLADYEDQIQSLHNKYDNLEEPTEEEQLEWTSAHEHAYIASTSAQEHAYIASDRLSAYSIKPTNIEFDVKSALEIVGSSAAISGATAALSKAGIVLLLCAAIYGNLKTEVKVEDAFVYWVGYKNRQPRWELPKNELPELVEEEKVNFDFEISIEGDEVFEAIKRLKRKGCLDEVDKDGEPYIVFRETCRVEWE